MDQIKLTKHTNGKVYLRCPYDKDLITFCRTFYGVWHGVLGLWIFPPGLDWGVLINRLKELHGKQYEITLRGFK